MDNTIIQHCAGEKELLRSTANLGIGDIDVYTNYFSQYTLKYSMK